MRDQGEGFSEPADAGIGAGQLVKEVVKGVAVDDHGSQCGINGGLGAVARVAGLAQLVVEVGLETRDLTPEKLLEHSRLPLAWHDQRIVLGFG
jgi:hypothetical protein